MKTAYSIKAGKPITEFCLIVPSGKFTFFFLKKC